MKPRVIHNALREIGEAHHDAFWEADARLEQERKKRAKRRTLLLFAAALAVAALLPLTVFFFAAPLLQKWEPVVILQTQGGVFAPGQVQSVTVTVTEEGVPDTHFYSNKEDLSALVDFFLALPMSPVREGGAVPEASKKAYTTVISYKDATTQTFVLQETLLLRFENDRCFGTEYSSWVAFSDLLATLDGAAEQTDFQPLWLIEPPACIEVCTEDGIKRCKPGQGADEVYRLLSALTLNALPEAPAPSQNRVYRIGVYSATGRAQLLTLCNGALKVKDRWYSLEDKQYDELKKQIFLAFLQEGATPVYVDANGLVPRGTVTQIMIAGNGKEKMIRDENTILALKTQLNSLRIEPETGDLSEIAPIWELTLLYNDASEFRLYVYASSFCGTTERWYRIDEEDASALQQTLLALPERDIPASGAVPGPMNARSVDSVLLSVSDREAGARIQNAETIASIGKELSLLVKSPYVGVPPQLAMLGHPVSVTFTVLYGNGSRETLFLYHDLILWKNAWYEIDGESAENLRRIALEAEDDPDARIEPAPVLYEEEGVLHAVFPDNVPLEISVRKSSEEQFLPVGATGACSALTAALDGRKTLSAVSLPETETYSVRIGLGTPPAVTTLSVYSAEKIAAIHAGERVLYVSLTDSGLRILQTAFLTEPNAQQILSQPFDRYPAFSIGDRYGVSQFSGEEKTERLRRFLESLPVRRTDPAYSDEALLYEIRIYDKDGREETLAFADGRIKVGEELFSIPSGVPERIESLLHDLDADPLARFSKVFSMHENDGVFHCNAGDCSLFLADDENERPLAPEAAEQLAKILDGKERRTLPAGRIADLVFSIAPDDRDPVRITVQILNEERAAIVSVPILDPALDSDSFVVALALTQADLEQLAELTAGN